MSDPLDILQLEQADEALDDLLQALSDHQDATDQDARTSAWLAYEDALGRLQNLGPDILPRAVTWEEPGPLQPEREGA